MVYKYLFSVALQPCSGTDNRMSKDNKLQPEVEKIFQKFFIIDANQSPRSFVQDISLHIA